MESRVGAWFEVLLLGVVLLGTTVPMAAACPLTTGGPDPANFVPVFTGASSIGPGTIFDNGNVGIGTTSPGWKLTVNGSFWANHAAPAGMEVAGTATAAYVRAERVVVGASQYDGRVRVNGNCKATKFIETSDGTLKENIRPIAGALDAVLALRGVGYNLRVDPETQCAGGSELGLLAQEVEKVLPAVVRTDRDDLKSIAYTRIVPVLIEAIKEQQRQIEQLEEEIRRVQ